MSDVLVLGGGICGLSTAMLLARDGHDATVLERDPEAPPETVEDAIETWNRSGVSQFRLAHYMHARFRHILDAELPDVRDALLDAGGTKYDLFEKAMPATLADRSRRPEDDRYWTVTGRRPVLEFVFARAAEAEPRVSLRRGTKVQELITGPEAIDGVPNVIGVKTVSGEVVRADLVIDAMGRASKLPDWLQLAGGRPPAEEAEECGFTYYGREFRATNGTIPDPAGPLLGNLGTISILTLPGDNNTWMVVLFTASGDMPLKELRHVEKWTRVVSSLPSYEHWLDGEALGDIICMSGIMDRYRRFVVDGKPVATGVLPVADAWACTNPSLGRGVSVGMMHVTRLRDVLRGSDGDPVALAHEWDAVTEAELTPWYTAQIAIDRARVAEINALREGREPAPDPQAEMVKGFFTAMENDPDMYRAFLEVMSCLATPEEVLSKPGAFEKMVAASQGKEPTKIPAPDRAELLEVVS